MPLRDLIVVCVVMGLLPYVLIRPHVGVLLWSWIGYMNPHRLTWGFAYNFPFAQLIGGATLVGLVLSKEPKRIPWNALTFVLVLFNLWMLLTTMFAIYPYAWEQWEKVIKIQIMVFITMMVITNAERLNQLVWVIAVSLGFYGIKGGIFAIMTGGQYKVIGPEKTFISGNTALALALVMTLPLLRYLQLQSTNRWIRRGLIAAMGLTGLAILASYSRGAFLALACMAAVLWWKSRHKLPLALALLALLPVGIMFMPEQYTERLETITEYEADGSAMGRIHAWIFATKMAIERPLGGGFESFTAENYARYAPELLEDEDRFQDAHSIYFEILGEHGFAGLALFLVTGVLGWRGASRVMRNARGRPDIQWMRDLAGMVQVSIAGYAVGGAFLGLAYFDLYYHLLAIIIVLNDQLARAASVAAPPPAVGAPAVRTGTPGSLAPHNPARLLRGKH